VRTVSEHPRHAPAHYTALPPCVDISGQSGGIPFPEYTGSGVPLAAHPFAPHKITSRWTLEGRCGACGSDHTLCIYLSYIGGVGTGQDMTLELVCQDCGKYTVETYLD